MMDLSIPYYEDGTRISNSAIGWFLKNGPLYLHKKLTGLIPDEKGPQLERGTMIHEFILQPEEFEKDYLVLPDSIKRPASDKQESFCRSLMKSTEFDPDRALLSAYRANYSIVGKSEAKILSEATEMAENLKDYIGYLKDGRTLITQRELGKCEDVYNNIQSHKFASKLLNDPNYEEHHEFHINWECNGVPCKSLLDCVKFDFKNKKCQIIDLKTTVKLWHFGDSIDQYDYLRQLKFYELAVIWYLINERGEDTKEWKFEFYIIGIDSTQTSEIRVFRFDDYVVDSRFNTIFDAINDIKWHQENNEWEHSRSYYEGDGWETTYFIQTYKAWQIH